MVASQDRFAHTLAEKLTAYALGRGVEYRGQPSVRAILRAAAAEDYRWSSIVLGIVGSPAFRMSRVVSPGGVIRLAYARWAMQIGTAGGGAGPTPCTVGPLIPEVTR